MNNIKEIEAQYDPEKLRASMERYKSTIMPPSGEIVPYKAPEPRIIAYEDLKRLFWQCWIDALGGRRPIIAESNKPHLHTIIRSLMSDDNKGIVIFGDYGRGKSKLLTAIIATCHKASAYDNVITIRQADSYKTLHTMAKNGDSIRSRYNTSKSYAIDDLGWNDEATVKIYGNKIALVSDIIYDRYSRWTRSQAKTYITTNITPDEIQSDYGQGVYGRLSQMCTMVYWDGPDFRVM